MIFHVWLTSDPSKVFDVEIGYLDIASPIEELVRTRYADLDLPSIGYGESQTVTFAVYRDGDDPSSALEFKTDIYLVAVANPRLATA
jgi:hypothetical protein